MVNLTIEELGFLQGLPKMVVTSRHIKATAEDTRIQALIQKLRDKELICVKFPDIKHGQPIVQDVDLTMLGETVVRESRS